MERRRRLERRRRELIAGLMLLACAAGRAHAQVTPRDSSVNRPTRTQSDGGGRAAHPARLDTVVTLGRASRKPGAETSANQGTVGAQDLAIRPLLRPGEIVEAIPGVIVTQHSGSGKANQYFLRGFNLDHGTDLALSLDGVPINMPSHAHGQGYADLNFVIPELIQRVDFQKGPYYADVGDFGSAGSLDIRYADRMTEGLVRVDGGQTGFARIVAANDAAVGDASLLYAGEIEHNDGPWDVGDDERKFNGLVRYVRGSAANRLTVTAMGYHNDWHATDQIPDRAIAQGLVDRWGEIDSTDGGATSRYALTAAWHAIGSRSTSHATVYALHYDLDLFSNFTYFLNDPIRGDQIEQQDNRSVFGGEVHHALLGSFMGFPSELTVGAQLRNDDIDNGLYQTEAKTRLDAVAVNWINETSTAPFVENRTTWTDWLRTVVGLRGDLVWLDVRNVTGGHAGDARGGLLSPKASVIVEPSAKLAFYVDGGDGFHSNDARGVVSRSDPAAALSRSVGGEVGTRTTFVPGLQSSLSLWLLDLTSELVWNGDAGDNVPSGPTRRYGIELANYYTPTRWLTIDADYAWSHARFTDHETAGEFVPEALATTFDGGIAGHDLPAPINRWAGGVRLRYFGPRPLTQNDSVRSRATTLLYADVAYRLSARWVAGLTIFNVLNTDASDIDYYYVSRLRGEPMSGVADIQTHPAEPREIRLSITARW
jgi:hypothetical protein